jgi:hypothetical protein
LWRREGGARLGDHFFIEKACLKIVFCVLIKANQRCKRIPMREKELTQIQALKNKLGIEDEKSIDVLKAA